MRRFALALLPLPLVVAAFVSASAPVALSGCLACTADYRVGLSITVLEAGTRRPIKSATVTVRDGDYREVVEPNTGVGSDNVYSAAGEREGTYDIDIVAEGYVTAHLENVEVDADECHVETRNLEVVLTPE